MVSLRRISKIRNLIITLLVILALMIGVYYYLFHTLKATGEKISTISNETTSKINEEGNLDSLRALFSATNNDRNELDSRFVASEGAIDFITTVENLATFAHLSHETESVNTGPANPPSPKYEFLHLTLKTTGSWQNTFNFLAMLETLPFNINITQTNLHATGETTNTSSAGTSSSTLSKNSSVWQGTYDFTVVKLK